MSHLWIVLVVAYVWMIMLGVVLATADMTVALRHRSDGSRVRRWSLFREGRQAFLAASPP